MDSARFPGRLGLKSGSQSTIEVDRVAQWGVRWAGLHSASRMIGLRLAMSGVMVIAETRSHFTFPPFP
jgi:hypothetical protein